MEEMEIKGDLQMTLKILGNHLSFYNLSLTKIGKYMYDIAAFFLASRMDIHLQQPRHHVIL